MIRLSDVRRATLTVTELTEGESGAYNLIIKDPAYDVLECDIIYVTFDPNEEDDPDPTGYVQDSSVSCAGLELVDFYRSKLGHSELVLGLEKLREALTIHHVSDVEQALEAINATQLRLKLKEQSTR